MEISGAAQVPFCGWVWVCMCWFQLGVFRLLGCWCSLSDRRVRKFGTEIATRIALSMAFGILWIWYILKEVLSWYFLAALRVDLLGRSVTKIACVWCGYYPLLSSFKTLLCSLCTWGKKDSVNEVPKPSGMDFFFFFLLGLGWSSIIQPVVVFWHGGLKPVKWHADHVRRKGKDCLQYLWVAVIWMFVL